MQLIRTIVASLDEGACPAVDAEVKFGRSGSRLRVACDGKAFGSIDPRYEHFLRSEKNKLARVASVDGDKATINVYAPERGSVTGNDGFIELSDGMMTYRPGDGRGEERRPVLGATANMESGAQLSERVTAGRIILVGVYAFALKKKSGGQKYLVVEGDGFAWAIEVEGEAINDAVRFAALVKSANVAERSHDTANEPDETVAGEPDMASEIERLAALYERGLLTDEEFSAAKRKVIGM